MQPSVTPLPFALLGIPAPLCQAVAEMGFEQPMPIQQAVIPFLLHTQHDLIALAQTGTGKTAAYGLPLLALLAGSTRGNNAATRQPQTLILSPTRELCLQITGDLQAYAAYMPQLHIAAVYGGAPLPPQQKALRKGVDIVVATPGRLIDLYNRGDARLDGISTLILDEADEMLNMGFREALDEILQALHRRHPRTLLFSATMSREVEQIAQHYLHEPEQIVVGSRNEGAENVNHLYYLVRAADKYLALKRIVDYHPRIYAIVFCRTKAETQQIADQLIRDGYNAEALHGDLAQQQRDLTMQKFRTHVTQLLIATDVAARGLDVDNLTHVIHYGLPGDNETYTHRAGRTGRAGKKGTSIAIVHTKEMHRIRDIEKQLGKQFQQQPLPSPDDICTKQLYKVIDEIEHTDVDEQQIAPFLQHLQWHFGYLDKDTIIQKVIAREFGKFLNYYAHAPEIEKVEAPKSRTTGKGKGRKDIGDSPKNATHKPERGYKVVQVNLGKHEGFYPGVVMQLINRYIPGRQTVGHIQLYEHKALIEVPARDADRVAKALNGKYFKNKEIKARTESR
ncbi:MAG: DEAD/DEAH box helicase [Bacteroidaceae bacterium]|nr:DEAD/DEAH box helicase [Bacteroidaceae bacterium]